MVGEYRILIKTQNDWLNTLLRSKFFDLCIHHEDLRKNEKNVFFCIDCSRVFCKHCMKSHYLHRHLQVLKYVYHDVVRLHDVQKHLDCSKIQTYKINGEKAVHLNPRPQSKDTKPSTKSKTGTACDGCGRYLQDSPNRFCSIACKVSVDYVEVKDQGNDMLCSIQKVADISLSCSTEEKESSSSISSEDFFSEEYGVWLRSSLKPRKQLHKRKGVPRRAPLC